MIRVAIEVSSPDELESQNDSTAASFQYVVITRKVYFLGVLISKTAALLFTSATYDSKVC